ncbi:MAG: acetyl-CoA carboxylase biotin carboxyl carrier protein subunit [Deltaproteobacteria bacterium]|nr:acetyl-CoA carboxylase biotin carboxyl carrier protein subunit [Deltaproteobacteria bacterium]
MSVEVLAPMPGVVFEVPVTVGDSVQEDDTLIVLEAMKMEVPVVAPSPGKVKEVLIKEKDSVKANQVLLLLE